jgi:hypothetical protein
MKFGPKLAQNDGKKSRMIIEFEEPKFLNKPIFNKSCF